MSVNVLLFLHLVGFAALSAGTFLGSITGAGARRTSKVAEHVVYAGLLKRQMILTMIGSWTLILTGLALVSTEGISHGTPWVSASMGLWVLSFLSAVLLGRPHAMAVGKALGEATGSGATESAALQALYGTGRAKMASRIQETLFLVNFLLMIFKPGA
jgi:hypothetical protein